MANPQNALRRIGFNALVARAYTAFGADPIAKQIDKAEIKSRHRALRAMHKERGR